MKFPAFYTYMCILYYGVIYTGNIYGVNYARNNINQIEKNPGIIIFSLIFSNPHLYERTGS